MITTQKQWLSNLEEKNGVFSIRGTSSPDLMGQRDWLKELDVCYGRETFKLEILIDIDSDDWSNVCKLSGKYIDALKKNNIPFIVFHSGNRGIHVHIFIEPATSIPEVICKKFIHNHQVIATDERLSIYYAKKLSKNMIRALKIFVLELGMPTKFKSLFGRPNNVIDGCKLDTGVTMKTGGLTRELGSQHNKSGMYASALISLPSQRPQISKAEDVVYPDKIVFWKPSDALMTQLAARFGLTKYYKMAEMPELKSEEILSGYFEHSKLACLWAVLVPLMKKEGRTIEECHTSALTWLSANHAHFNNNKPLPYKLRQECQTKVNYAYNNRENIVQSIFYEMKQSFDGRIPNA